MAAAASQAVSRVSSAEPGRSPGDAPVPSFSLTESPVPLLMVMSPGLWAGDKLSVRD
jgi:hypothetical protein